MNKLVLNISLLLLALLGALSCNIKEDMSDCPGRMILDYSAYPDEILDDIADDEQIDVFIFDANNICCDTRTFTYGELLKQGLEFKLPINYRNHNAVVWQGLNSLDYDSSTMALGKKLEDFYLELITISNSFKGVPSSLWATALEPIEYCAKITRHRVHMTRLHTQINVTLQEKHSDGTLTNLEAGIYDVCVRARDDVYNTDYTIDETSQKVDYVNDGSEVGALRLTPDMSCKLSVEGIDYSVDLIKYMLKSKSDAEISDQRFLDLNKVWDVTLIVKEYTDGSYVAIGISVNGWVTWFTSSDLS